MCQCIILAISSQNCMKSNEIGPGARPQLPLGFLKLSLGGYLKPRYVTALVSRIFRNLCISWKMRTLILNRHIIHYLQVTGFMTTFSKELATPLCLPYEIPEYTPNIKSNNCSSPNLHLWIYCSTLLLTLSNLYTKE